MAINYLNNSKNLLLTQSNSNQFLQGEQLYTTPGTYNWIAPPEVTSVNVVCVGGGGGCGGFVGNYGGGGGGLGWKNNIPVVPGNSYTVVVGAGGQGGYGVYNNGGTSYFIDTNTVSGGGGSAVNGNGGSFTGDGGSIGGRGGVINSGPSGGGGGGAGGYFYSTSVDSGRGWQNYTQGTAGAGGGGAGGLNSGGGGGVGLYGNPVDGLNPGNGGSGGTNGTVGGGGGGGNYGGGAGGGQYTPNKAGDGAVRIFWNINRFIPFTSSYTLDVQVQYLVVAGGGGGGSDFGGGGGAGGLNTGIFFAYKNKAYNITIGAGGSRGASQGQSGSSGTFSRFATQIVDGGGGGGRYNSVSGANGGSGGGGGGSAGSGGIGNQAVTWYLDGGFPVGINNQVYVNDAGPYMNIGYYNDYNIPLGQEIIWTLLNISYGRIKWAYPNPFLPQYAPTIYILDTSTNNLTASSMRTMTRQWTNPNPGFQTSVQGFNGGSSAGGGGGAGSVGSNGEGGQGGRGVASIISGSTKLYAGGGGGGSGSGGKLNNGGSGIGGSGAGWSGDSTGIPILSTAGVVSTGSGGGGGAATGGQVSLGGNGSSGIVILRYPKTATVSFAAGLTTTTITLGDFKITSVTSGTGNVTFS